MFEFTSPQTLDEAFQLWHDKARWFAGGTDLIPEMRLGLAQFARLVNLKQISELRGITQTSEGVRIGALTTLTEIAESQIIRDHYAALAEACDFSASPQLRNVATIGGNLVQDSRCPYYRGDFNCWLKGGKTCFMREGESREAAVIGYGDCVHVHPSDPANALVALETKVNVHGPNGIREIDAGEFLNAPSAGGKRMTGLKPDEIITSYQLPRFENAHSAYLKEMDRATWTFALASATVRLELRENTRRVARARVVLGGVAPVPWREHRAEELLVGETISEKVAARAAEECLRDAQPFAHNAYKVRLARTLVKRAILRCAS